MHQKKSVINRCSIHSRASDRPHKQKTKRGKFKKCFPRSHHHHSVHANAEKGCKKGKKQQQQQQQRQPSSNSIHHPHHRSHPLPNLDIGALAAAAYSCCFSVHSLPKKGLEREKVRITFCGRCVGTDESVAAVSAKSARCSVLSKAKRNRLGRLTRGAQERGERQKVLSELAGESCAGPGSSSPFSRPRTTQYKCHHR